VFTASRLKTRGHVRGGFHLAQRRRGGHDHARRDGIGKAVPVRVAGQTLRADNGRKRLKAAYIRLDAAAEGKGGAAERDCKGEE
jgi:hypothetical protein